MEKLLKFSEVAKEIGVHRATLRNWVARGNGPEVTLLPGGRLRFTESALKEWRDNLERIKPSES